MRFDAPLVDTFREMQRIAAPEVDVYICIASPDDLRGELAMFSECDGVCCAPSPDVEEFLRNRGQWRGAFPLIAISPDVPDQCSNFSWTFNGLFVHELAHAAELAASPRPATQRQPLTAQQARQQSASMIAMYEEDKPSLYPWIFHGKRFTRFCVHIAWRLVAAGYHIPIVHACGGETYGLSSAFTYLDVLADEAEEFAGATFAEIEACEAPPAFLELWESDVARWKEEHYS